MSNPELPAMRLLMHLPKYPGFAVITKMMIRNGLNNIQKKPVSEEYDFISSVSRYSEHALTW